MDHPAGAAGAFAFRDREDWAWAVAGAAGYPRMVPDCIPPAWEVEAEVAAVPDAGAVDREFGCGGSCRRIVGCIGYTWFSPA